MSQPFYTRQSFTTFADIVCYRGRTEPDALAYTFLEGESTVKLTHLELELRARQIAQSIVQVARPGDRVLLLHQPGLDYVCSFFACQYARVIAVPAYPPLTKRYAERVIHIVRHSGARLALVADKWREKISRALSSETLEYVSTDMPSDGEAAAFQWQPGSVAGTDIAFIQYTSGSTAEPKGVMVSHFNLLHNSEKIKSIFGHTRSSVGMVWLPPYHDMGLIGGILQPLYSGFPVYLMAPSEFVEAPVRWLEAISNYKVTTSGGPSFAYDLCNRKITQEHLEGLDLSRWQVAFTGAEQIQAHVLERFADTFAPCGFRRAAFLPCYGLAEATLIVSGRKSGRMMKTMTLNRERLGEGKAVADHSASSDTLTIVGCGEVDGETVFIVDQDRHELCESGKIGEIWLRSDSNAQGYLNDKALTAEMFGAALNSADDQGHYLRTGDLGFIHEQELYITGRLKELIVIRGVNYYPGDIEAGVEALDERFVAGGCAAFSTVDESGTEQLVIVQEVSRHYRGGDYVELAACIREGVAARIGIVASAIVLIRQGSLPKTSSGKVMRRACRSRFEQGGYDEGSIYRLQACGKAPGSSSVAITLQLAAEQWQAMGESERIAYLNSRIALLAAQCGLHIEQGTKSSLLSQGLDSVAAVSLKSAVEEEFGVQLPLEALLSEQMSPYALRVWLESQEPGERIPRPALIPAAGAALVELSDDQRRLRVVEQMLPDVSALHIPVAFEVKGALDPSRLRESLHHLLDRYPTLRTRFITVEGVEYQSALDAEEQQQMWSFLELQADSERELLLLQEASRPFDMRRGPLFRLAVVKSSATVHTLLLVAHHSIADLKSMFIAAEELFRLYSSEKPDGDEQPVAFADYLLWNKERLKAVDTEAQIAVWQQHLQDIPPMLKLPTDYERPQIRSLQGRQRLMPISSELSLRIHEFCKAYGATPYMTLAAAFSSLLHLLSGSQDVVFGSPIDGRRSRQLAGSIGFYAQPAALRIGLNDSSTFWDHVQQIRRATIHALSNQDVTFATIVERVNPVRNPGYHPVFQHMFSYLKMESELAAGSSLEIMPICLSECSTEFDLFVTLIENSRGELTGICGYNSGLFSEDTMANMTALFVRILEYGLEHPKRALNEDHVPYMEDIGAIRAITPTLAIASTFTSEMIEESLRFWSDKIGYAPDVKFAPYNQLFQQLLQPQSLLAANRNGCNVLLLRFSDLLAGKRSSPMEEEYNQLSENARWLAEAIKSFSARSSVPMIVGICPEAPDVQEKYDLIWSKLEDMYRELLSAAQGVHLLGREDMNAGYRMDSYYDAFSDETSHIPYHYSYFSVIGTAVSRTLFHLLQPSPKVLVLDCDNTLWSGVCGEDGVQGVIVDERSRQLQRFVLEQHRQGMLLCLCSKNNEQDVWRVFDTRQDMLLQRSHIAAWQLNWESKSSNLLRLAAQLSLSTDSFIFLDDNPVECAEVELHLPEVQVIQVNDGQEPFEQLVRRLWLFDRGEVTEEDRQRTRRYQENKVRESYIEGLAETEAMTYERFISELQMEVKQQLAAEEQLPRISQLTFRTNQFNFTGERMSQEQLKGEMERGMLCYAIQARDRFGDYGLVGAIVARIQDQHYIIHHWLLSCRVLGRGVEYKLLQNLCQQAEQAKVGTIVLEWVRTNRNAPAMQFIEQIAGVKTDEQSGRQRAFIPLAHVQAAAAKGAASELERPAAQAQTPMRLTGQHRACEVSRWLKEMKDVSSLALAVQKHGSVSFINRIHAQYVAPRNAVEQTVAEIWMDVLKVERVSVEDNFFFIGGHSLLSHQVIYRLREAFNMDIPLDLLFTTDFTVASIAAAIEGLVVQQTDEAELEQLTRQLEQLSDEEIQRLLQESEW